MQGIAGRSYFDSMLSVADLCSAPHLSNTRRFCAQGIAGHGYFDNCVVPIIENTARECELTGASCVQPILCASTLRLWCCSSRREHPRGA